MHRANRKFQESFCEELITNALIHVELAHVSLSGQLTLRCKKLSKN